MTILQLLEEKWGRFVQRLRTIEGASNDTVMSYRHSWNLYRRFLEESGIEEISTQSVEEFLLWLGEQGYSKNSIKRHYYALKKFLCWAGFCDEVRWKDIRPRGEQKYEYVILSEDEVQQLVNAAFEIRPVYGLMLWVGYEAALRASELVSLRVKQIDLSRRAIVKRPLKREQPCEAPLSDELAAHLDQWLRDLRPSPEDYVFKTKFGRPWNRSAFHRYVFQAAAERAGLLAKYPNLRYHDFARHSRATNLLRKGVDVYTVNKIMCHRLLETTMIYLHIVQADELRRRMESREAAGIG